MKFKEGQEVIVNNPGPMVGTIVRPRPGDSGQQEEKTHYKVDFAAKSLWVLSTNIEPVPAPRIMRFSAEWLAEAARGHEAFQRLSANRNDAAALSQVIESGTKLGYLVPIDADPEK